MTALDRTIVAFFNETAETVFAAKVDGGQRRIEYTGFCDAEALRTNSSDQKIVWTGPESDFKYAGKVKISAEEAELNKHRLCPPRF